MKEIEFKVELENFYCPITGQQVLQPENFTPSPAMVFAFLHSENFFEYLQKDLQEQFSEEFSDEGQHGDLYLKLTENIMKKEQNYLWITYGGPPFGAVSMCFDMAHLNEDR